MQIFVYFGLLIVFSLWLQYEIKKNSRLSKKGTEEFWKKEAQANLVRRADISTLDYITIPLDQLPLKDSEDPTVNSYRDTIVGLSGKKILNLTGITNTDLKLKYGPSNIKQLTECDNNYTTLVSILHKWGERLYRNGHTEESLAVLEYSVQCLTEVRNTYRLLAHIYKSQNASDKINSLLEILPLTGMIGYNNLIGELSNIKHS